MPTVTLADEFPTLEVALAVCVLWLSWRGWVLARSAASLDVEVDDLAAALQRGEEPPAPSRRGAEALWLVHLARAARAAQHAEPAEPGRDPLRERTQKIRRRLRSAAARDLVVCAVLLGSLAYGRTASLGVSSAFFALGALSGLLLLIAVGLRLWLDRQVDSVGRRFIRALGGRGAPLPATRALGACPKCGAAELESVSGARNLGKKLRSLGVEQVQVCASCGHVGGHVVER